VAKFEHKHNKFILFIRNLYYITFFVLHEIGWLYRLVECTYAHYLHSVCVRRQVKWVVNVLYCCF